MKIQNGNEGTNKRIELILHKSEREGSAKQTESQDINPYKRFL